MNKEKVKDVYIWITSRLAGIVLMHILAPLFRWATKDKQNNNSEKE